MTENRQNYYWVTGVSIFLGLVALGYLLGSSIIKVKQLERTVVVKGLSEREVEADVALWPIQFRRAANDIAEIYRALEKDAQKIIDFLQKNGIRNEEISVSAPAITDKLAREYGGAESFRMRYVASQTITVYSSNIKMVRNAMMKLVELGKQGIVFSGENYENRTEYLFTRLNELKPVMVEEATRKAREVAEKFARDSNSKLGKIKRASQGQFSIRERDRNTPYIKKVRVVSTVEYYLVD
ncbi:MAG: SIMPL domain-containing protein [Calditrichia bacterium]